MGDGFDLVVPLIYYISPIMIIVGISNVLGNQYLLPTEQQKSFTISIIAGALVNLILNSILIRFFDAIGASIATVAAEGTVALVQCYFVRKQIDLLKCIKPLAKYILFGVIMFIAVRGVSHTKLAGAWLLILQVSFGIIVYAGLLLLNKDEFVRIALRKFVKEKE